MALVDFDGLPAGSFPGEASVVGYPQYRRRVDFTPGPQGLTGAVRVQVTVEYQSMTTGPRMVTLATVLSRR